MSDSRFATVLAVVTLAFIVVSMGFISTISNGLGRLQSQLSTLESSQNSQGLQLSALAQKIASAQSGVSALPLMNQTTTIREVRMTWYLSPEAHQDRFDPSFVVVNQGDMIHLTLIDNDTVAHDFVIGPPYDVVVNATVPGLINDLTGQDFTTPAKNNSPGVVVTGTVGNVSATYSFVAKHAGVYEFVCTYHAEVGMIGYLVVLPNAAYGAKSSAGHLATSQGAAKVNIVPGAGSDTTIKGYSPGTITVVVGINNTITWVNNDSSPHTVTADDGRFGSENIAPGDSFSYTFTTAGTYKYHCIYHPWMTGIVIVK